MSTFTDKMNNVTANPVAFNPVTYFTSTTDARRVLADGMSSTARKNAAYAYLAANSGDVKGANTTKTDTNTTVNDGVTDQNISTPAAPAAPSRASLLKAQSNSTLDELLSIYDQLIEQIKVASGDQTNRINGNYDQKVDDQGVAMNEGMYAVDAGAAASNLADSSYRSTDRSKVRTATEKNIGTLNEGRATDLAELGKLVNTDIAKYSADKNGLGVTRQLLNDTTDESELSKSVASLSSAKNGATADMAKYGKQGDFTAAANKLGAYDTSKLEATLQSVVNNGSATPSAKSSTIKDIIDGTGISEDQKNVLRTKYNQIIG